MKKHNGSCIFLVAGRLIYRKGIGFLFDALERIPENLDYQCRIVGSGTEYNALQERWINSKLLKQHVIFKGKISFNDMEKEFMNANVLIMPSIRETTGSVLLEAMSWGLPVITIDSFGGKIIVNEEVGWLYSGKSKEDYMNALISAISDCILHPDEVNRKGNNARIQSHKYTWNEKNKIYNNIYRELLKESDSPL